MDSHIKRRDWLQGASLALSAGAIRWQNAGRDANPIVIDPAPRFEISPNLYMQFMEPLGSTDSSVEAAWDYTKDAWREDFVEVVKRLAPGVIRFGGNFSRYYRWREGVGPVQTRPWMRNYDWGGKETNRVGTDEFVSLCRAVGAEPFYCVNFEGEGIEYFRHTPEGDRTGNAQEAADWVSYANDPDHKEREANGHAEPYGIKFWQIGNETSYLKEAFPKEQAIRKTIEFAKAMRARDAKLQLIGWGDKGRGSDALWAEDMLQKAGEHLDYLAIHMMGQSPKRQDTLLSGLRYQQDPHGAWQELLELSQHVETRVAELEQVLTYRRWPGGIAVTEGHLSLRPHNVNPLLYEWVSAVYHARSLNIYQRHGARVKIATAADFNGTRWTVMAVQTPVPRGRTFLMPVGSIAQLFKTRNGEQGVEVSAAPADLDIAAARTGDKLFLHVANLNSRRPVHCTLHVKDRNLAGGYAYEIAPGDLRRSVDADTPDSFNPTEWRIEASEHSFAPASVSVLELQMA